MRVSVVIPVYNERPTIEECLKRVRAVGLDKEIVVVDDASTDGTREFLAALPAEPNLRIFYQPDNRGKGAAVRRGFDEATGDVVVIQDADLEYDPEDYHKLIEPIRDGRADVVYGSRFLGWPRRVLLLPAQLANRFLTLLSNLVTDLNLTDMETCYKVITREVVKSLRLRSDRFGIEPEITAKIARLGFRVYEVADQLSRPRLLGRQEDRLEGRLRRDRRRSCATPSSTTRKTSAPDIAFCSACRKSPATTAGCGKQLEPYVGRRVLEVGAGVGNMTRFLLRRERVIATDLDAKYLRILHHLFDSYTHVTIGRFDLGDRPPATETDGAVDLPGAERIDTVVCLNVLEHIEDDERALRTFHELLEPGGRLILLVPALQSLYGSLDRALDHFRRYERAELLDKLGRAGFEIEASWFFNLLGVFGWYLNSRLLKRTTFPPVQLTLYDLLVPLFRLESRWRLPFGMSLIAIARKPAVPQGSSASGSV